LSGQHLGEGSFQLHGAILDVAMRDLYGTSAGDAGISASTLVEPAHPWVLVT